MKNECDKHVWDPDPSGPFPWCCRRCGAYAADCPECQVAPEFAASCTRCNRTGKMELCEIGQQEVSQLRLTKRRFEWLLTVWAEACGDRTADVIAYVDECLTRDISPLSVAAMTGSRIKGRKKPASGLNRPRAGRGPSDEPGRQTNRSSGLV